MKNYPDLAMRTNSPNAGNFGNVHPWLLHAALGLCDEANELKCARIGSVNEKEELGDLLWFCALAGQILKAQGGVDVWSNNYFQTDNASVGQIITSAGEIAGLVKKPFAYGPDKPVPYLQIGGEIMVIIATVEAIGKARGWSMDEIKRANIAKLQERFPEKFDSHAAYNRDTEAEANAIHQEGN